MVAHSSSARTADSSRASSSSLTVVCSIRCLCVSFVTLFTLHCWLLLTLTLFASLLDLVGLAAPPGLCFGFFWN